MTSLSQRERITSELRSYSALKFIYDIGSWPGVLILINNCQIIYQLHQQKHSQIILNGLFHSLFLLNFVFFKQVLHNENCRLQQDSNLDRWSRGQALWPHDQHHGCGIQKMFSNVENVILLVRSSTFYKSGHKFLEQTNFIMSQTK